MDEERTATPEETSPRIRRLSRRDALKIAAAGGGVAAAGLLGWLAIRDREPTPGGDAAEKAPTAGGTAPQQQPPEGYTTMPLAEGLMPNPAFWATMLPSGKLLAWVRRKRDMSVIGYELNEAGLLVWRLCDGRRTPEQVAREYAARGGGDEAEAMAFVADLREKGLLVAGGYMVAGPGFPPPAETRRYFRVLGDDEPWMG